MTLDVHRRPSIAGCLSRYRDVLPPKWLVKQWHRKWSLASEKVLFSNVSIALLCRGCVVTMIEKSLVLRAAKSVD
jgi:hypothetical protein